MPDEQLGFPGMEGGESAFSSKRRSAFGGPLPGAPQGQLFSTKPYEKKQEPPKEPGWGVPHGRPNYPGQGPKPQPRAEQQQFDFNPSPFAKSGLRRYVNRNANGLQFNKPAIGQAVDNITMGLAKSKHARNVGFGESLRTSFGLRPIPSHYNDYMYARHNQSVRGHNPDSIAAQRSSFDPDTYLHF